MEAKSLIGLVVESALLGVRAEKLDGDELDAVLVERRQIEDELVERIAALRPKKDEERWAERLATQMKAGELNDAEGHAQVLLPEQIGLAYYGWTTKPEDVPVEQAVVKNGELLAKRELAWDEWNGSECMGPGCDIEDEEAVAEMILEDLTAFALEDDATILHRWDRAEDDLELLDLIAQNGLQFANDEILLAYRRRQLHEMCRRYFGTADYQTREIVTRWEKNERGRWMPAEKMTVAEWIARASEGWYELVEVGDGEFEVEAHGGTNLSGYMSCLRTLQFKIARKQKPKATRGQLNAYVQRQRILNTAQVEAVVHKAVAGVVEDTVEGYFAL